LFQLGGSDSLGVEAVLAELVPGSRYYFPWARLDILRRPIAKLISSRRCIPVAGKYAEIGRRSPIGTLTERQRVRLVAAVFALTFDPVAVTAMRYWRPFTADAVETLRNAGPLDEIVLLPLYPTTPTPLR